MPFQSQALYSLFVIAVAGARLVELRIAKRNTETLRRRGAIEVGREHYPWMVRLHAAWLFAAPLEVVLLDRPWIPGLAIVSGVLFSVGMAIRYWVIRTLGERWTTRVLCLPDTPLVTGGPYRFLRHPNYAAVVLEIAFLPLVHTAWLTALVFTALNAVLLRARIAIEDRGLAEWSERDDATRP